MPLASTALGPYDLVAPLATGGMGEVWRAVHRERGIPVALKVLTEVGGQNPNLVRAMRDEVRAVAGLDHPRIVQIYDQGQVDEASARAAGGRLVAGTPWLALELVDGGTLSTRRDVLDWTGILRLLMEVLDALAHAHARGVIHRDIKPANILWGGRSVGWKLTDFGMVYTPERDMVPGAEPMSGGTPAWMAPEQFSNHWRDQGPWTDLYALGCLTWALLCGQRPFRSNDFHVLAEQHQAAEIPPLLPRVPAPEGVDAWIRRMTRKRPADRFRRAADAAWALMELGAPVGTDTRTASTVSPDAPTRLHTAQPSEVTQLWSEPVDTRPARAEPAPVMAPPLPGHWRQRIARSEAALTGIGMALFSLRARPLVGREAERDLLWEALRSVERDRTARAVVLRGPGGCGKSRLAQWIARRAHEEGASIALSTTHEPGGGARHGLPGLVSRALRTLGADREQTLERLNQVFEGAADTSDVPDLLELLHPPVAMRGAATARHRLVGRWLGSLARERPLLLWLDDVQWGIDSLAFTRWWLDSDLAVPSLVVLTAQEEALATQQAAADALGRLGSHERVDALFLGPIPTDHRLDLVQSLLPLEPTLARRLATQTAGNPLFAEHLVGDWVSRGLLKFGPDGFALESEIPALPERIEDVWRARLERLFEQQPSWRAPLEIAGVLGPTVDIQEWTAACALAEVPIPFDLVGALEDERLARRHPTTREVRWSFVHVLLCETVRTLAEDAGRAPQWHRACVEMLARDGSAGTAGRRGLHLVAAGEAAQALPLLLSGTREALGVELYSEAERLLDAVPRAHEQLGHGPEDPARVAGWLALQELRRAQGRFDEAGRAVERALAVATGAQRAEALYAHALIPTLESRLETYGLRAQVALEYAQEVGREDLESASEALLGHHAMNLGDYPAARIHLQRALASDRAAGRLSEQADHLVHLAVVDLQTGNPDGATERADAVEALFVALHSRRVRGELALLRGEIRKFAGDVHGAIASYRTAWEQLSAVGHVNEGLARLNLGVALAEAGALEDAAAHLEATLDRSQARFHTFGANLGLLMCNAADPGDGWERHWSAVVAWLAEGWQDVDFARSVELAADRASNAGYPVRARDAWQLAATLWEQLGRPDRVAAIQARIE